MFSYLLLFIVGGTFTVLTKYLTNQLSPKLGAILATLPVGLFSAYFIVHEDKLPSYLSNYLLQTSFLVIATMIYLYLLNHGLLKHRTIYVLIFTFWLIFVSGQIYYLL
jgi:hypothetical protein